MVSHAELEAAVQEQPVGIVTVTVPVEPAPVRAAGAAERTAVQAAAACVTVATAAPALTVVERAVEAGLAVREKDALPLPAPFTGAFKVSHGSFAVTNQAHPLGALTDTEPVPASAVNEPGAASESPAQGEGAATEPEPVADRAASQVSFLPIPQKNPVHLELLLPQNQLSRSLA